jgi:hypothetical protein
MSKEERLGLKKLRHASGKHPTYECPNCNCKRFTTCYCKVKVNKKEETNG